MKITEMSFAKNVVGKTGKTKEGNIWLSIKWRIKEFYKEREDMRIMNEGHETRPEIL